MLIFLGTDHIKKAINLLYDTTETDHLVDSDPTRKEGERK